MSTTTESGEDPMIMKNPPHPGTVILEECIEPLELTITQAAAALGVHTEYALGIGQPEARYIAGNGCAVVKGRWGQRRKLAHPAGTVRSCPRARR